MSTYRNADDMPFCGERAIRRFKSGAGIRAARPSPILTVPNRAENTDRANLIEKYFFQF